jgi:hypothetical protein
LEQQQPPSPPAVVATKAPDASAPTTTTAASTSPATNRQFSSSAASVPSGDLVRRIARLEPHFETLARIDAYLLGLSRLRDAPLRRTEFQHALRVARALDSPFIGRVQAAIANDATLSPGDWRSAQYIERRIRAIVDSAAAAAAPAFHDEFASLSTSFTAPEAASAATNPALTAPFRALLVAAGKARSPFVDRIFAAFAARAQPAVADFNVALRHAIFVARSFDGATRLFAAVQRLPNFDIAREPALTRLMVDAFALANDAAGIARVYDGLRHAGVHYMDDSSQVAIARALFAVRRAACGVKLLRKHVQHCVSKEKQLSVALVHEVMRGLGAQPHGGFL